MTERFIPYWEIVSHYPIQTNTVFVRGMCNPHRNMVGESWFLVALEEEKEEKQSQEVGIHCL